MDGPARYVLLWIIAVFGWGLGGESRGGDAVLPDLIRQLDRLEHSTRDFSRPASSNQLHDLQNRLETRRWQDTGAERLLVSLQLARVQRLWGNYDQAEQEIRVNGPTFQRQDEQVRQVAHPELSLLPYALYELGKLDQALAEKNGKDSETQLAYRVKALKQFYRILKEYPKHPLRVKAGAELLASRNRLEQLLDAEVPLPDITIPRPCNSLDELTPDAINRMLEKRDYTAALPQLQQVVQTNQGDERLAGTLLKIAVSQAHLGQGAKAVATLETMVSQYQEAAQTGEALAVCGRILWEKKQHETAIKIFEMLLDNAPQHPLTGRLALLAVQEYLHFGGDHLNPALDICDKLIESNRDAAVVKTATYREGEIFLQQEKYADAAGCFGKYADQEKTDLYRKRQAVYLTAYCLFQAGGNDQAGRAVALLNQLENDRIDRELGAKSRLLLASIAEKTGHVRDAVGQYERFRKEYPDDVRQPEIYARLGGLYYQLQERQQAAALLAQLIRRYPTSEAARNAVFNLGRMLYDAGDYGEAIAQFQQLTDNPSTAKISHLLWITRHLGNCGKDSTAGAAIAMAAGTWLLARIQDDSTGHDDPLLMEIRGNSAMPNEILFYTAQAAFVAGKYQSALTLFDRLLQSREIPSYYEAKMLRAQTCFALKNPAAGRRDLAEAAMAALQDHRPDEYARLQCCLADSYMKEGEFKKPYVTWKLLDAPTTPAPWREYAVFKAAVCAKKLNWERDYAMLRDRYREQFPQGKFVRDLN